MIGVEPIFIEVCSIIGGLAAIVYGFGWAGSNDQKQWKLGGLLFILIGMILLLAQTFYIVALTLFILLGLLVFIVGLAIILFGVEIAFNGKRLARGRPDGTLTAWLSGGAMSVTVLFMLGGALISLVILTALAASK